MTRDPEFISLAMDRLYCGYSPFLQIQQKHSGAVEIIKWPSK